MCMEMGDKSEEYIEEIQGKNEEVNFFPFPTTKPLHLHSEWAHYGLYNIYTLSGLTMGYITF